MQLWHRVLPTPLRGDAFSLDVLARRQTGFRVVKRCECAHSSVGGEKGGACFSA